MISVWLKDCKVCVALYLFSAPLEKVLSTSAKEEQSCDGKRSFVQDKFVNPLQIVVYAKSKRK